MILLADGQTRVRYGITKMNLVEQADGSFTTDWTCKQKVEIYLKPLCPVLLETFLVIPIVPNILSNQILAPCMQ